ncbi:hypothetical protein D3C80_1771300 [compost metagenome]
MAIEWGAAAAHQRIGHAHGAQITHQREYGIIPHGIGFRIGDGERKASALQQGTNIAHIGERNNTRTGTAGQLGLGAKQHVT